MVKLVSCLRGSRKNTGGARARENSGGARQNSGGARQNSEDLMSALLDQLTSQRQMSALCNVGLLCQPGCHNQLRLDDGEACEVVREDLVRTLEELVSPVEELVEALVKTAVRLSQSNSQRQMSALCNVRLLCHPGCH